MRYGIHLHRPASQLRQPTLIPLHIVLAVIIHILHIGDFEVFDKQSRFSCTVAMDKCLICYSIISSEYK